MIERTEKRLRQAQFFYRCLESSKDLVGHYKNEPEAFEFYLEAFMQVARTVPWVLQTEEKEKYEAWKPAWENQLNSEEQELLKFTNDCRLDVVHRGGIETIIEWEKINIYELLKVSPPPHQSMIFDVQSGQAYDTHTSAPTETERPGVDFVIPVFHFNRNGVNENVTVTCRKYLNYLEKFVREFKQAHNETGSTKR